jgi:hypothetical protein
MLLFLCLHALHLRHASGVRAACLLKRETTVSNDGSLNPSRTERTTTCTTGKAILKAAASPDIALLSLSSEDMTLTAKAQGFERKLV